MHFHSYLRKEIVYIPTVVQLETGACVDVDPVAVVPVANTDALRRAFLDTIKKENAVVPKPDQWPRPVVLKYADVKTWSAFARSASMWSIKESNGDFQIMGYREHPDGYWKEDPEQRSDLPPGSTVGDVVDRMVAVLQEAAQVAAKARN